MAEMMFVVSLRVEHPTQQHEAIARALALKAKFGYSVGEQRKTPKGGLLEGLNKKTYCCFDLLPKQPGDFTDGIRQLIPLLSKHGSYFQSLVLEGGRAELFVGVFAEETTGFTLSVQDMATLANLSLELSVEIYY